METVSAYTLRSIEINTRFYLARGTYRKHGEIQIRYPGF